MEQAVQDLECLKKRAVGELYEGKLCAVSRAERIANRVGRSSGHIDSEVND